VTLSTSTLHGLESSEEEEEEGENDDDDEGGEDGSGDFSTYSRKKGETKHAPTG